MPSCRMRPARSGASRTCSTSPASASAARRSPASAAWPACRITTRPAESEAGWALGNRGGRPLRGRARGRVAGDGRPRRGSLPERPRAAEVPPHGRDRARARHRAHGPVRRGLSRGRLPPHHGSANPAGGPGRPGSPRADRRDPRRRRGPAAPPGLGPGGRPGPLRLDRPAVRPSGGRAAGAGLPQRPPRAGSDDLARAAPGLRRTPAAGGAPSGRVPVPPAAIRRGST